MEAYLIMKVDRNDVTEEMMKILKSKDSCLMLTDNENMMGAYVRQLNTVKIIQMLLSYSLIKIKDMNEEDKLEIFPLFSQFLGTLCVLFNFNFNFGGFNPEDETSKNTNRH